MIARGKRMGGGRKGYGGINGNGWKTCLRVMNTQYSVQMMYCEIVHLKPV